VVRHPAHFIALSGGIGLIPFAPGSFGTLLAFPVFWLSGEPRDPWFLLVLVALFALGVWACDVTGRALGDPDHGAMVWDETVAFLLVLFFTPVGDYWQAFAFLVFRFFDIAKPPPIRYYERTIKGGMGTMIDDIAAACYALLVLALARAAMG
jgi:phosphatidylglycerophosphatase A